MGKVAYTTEGAAKAASVSHHAIKVAIQEDRLVARVLGATTIVEKSDLRDWIRSLPAFSPGRATS
jgi:hypothetical protein